MDSCRICRSDAHRPSSTDVVIAAPPFCCVGSSSTRLLPLRAAAPQKNACSWISNLYAKAHTNEPNAQFHKGARCARAAAGLAMTTPCWRRSRTGLGTTATRKRWCATCRGTVGRPATSPSGGRYVLQRTMIQYPLRPPPKHILGNIDHSFAASIIRNSGH